MKTFKRKQMKEVSKAAKLNKMSRNIYIPWMRMLLLVVTQMACQHQAPQ